MKKTALFLLLGAALAAAQTRPAPARRTPAAGARPGTAARVSLLNPSTMKAQAPATYQAKFTTTKGDFVIEVNRSWSPLGADRFYNLVRNGYFTDASFFRVVPGFVVQFGLSARPEVNAAWMTANLTDDPVTQSNRRGYVSFATSGPNTRSTQLFINLADNQRLDGMGFSPIGQVTAGMEIVDQLYSGYGESPDQGRVTSEGKAYLQKNFPQLDSIKSATIVLAAGAAPAAKPPVTKPAATTPKQ